MRPLIIVESYTKTKTISKYLDNKYDVICSLGHINNLPKTELGIDTNTWSGNYVATNAKIISNIRSHVKQTNIIYIASDPDMEGEAIAYHIRNAIQDLLKNKECHRVEFHEITKKAVTYALQNPHDINQDKVNAQESRRFVDRLVGYKLSPLLWDKFNDNALSVGRVQTAALYMCTEMLSQIESHNINQYWIVVGSYTNSICKNVEFKLYDNNDMFKTHDKNKLMHVIDSCKFDEAFDMQFIEKSSSESPDAPYTTTSLQQDAYHKCGFSSKKTMQLAQQLYESGYITYMRTDSTNISNDFKNVIIKYVDEVYGTGLSQFRSYKNKICNAQEAHEAIRITNVNTVKTDISDEHNKLYSLIWKRTIACQMINAEFANIDVQLHYADMQYVFIHKKSLLIKQGYKIVYEQPLDDVNAFKQTFINLKAKEFKAESKIENPPSLYNEIGLIKALEKKGIGRPSTFASIIDKLYSKKYVTKGKNPSSQIMSYDIVKTKHKVSEKEVKLDTGGKSKDLLIPTELGKNIINYLQTSVPFLLDLQFTANMEDALDKICDRSLTKEFVLNDFYQKHLLPIVSSSVRPRQQAKLESGIIKTKYGYCYYHSHEKRYTNIESYLKWKNKSADELSLLDINFLKSLPRKLEDGTELHIGQYGLYIKNKNKNVKLEKDKWQSFVS